MSFRWLIWTFLSPSQVLVVSVDGSCSGVQAVKDGQIGATAMQFPLLMASLGVEAVAQYEEQIRSVLAV